MKKKTKFISRGTLAALVPALVVGCASPISWQYQTANGKAIITGVAAACDGVETVETPSAVGFWKTPVETVALAASEFEMTKARKLVVSEGVERLSEETLAGNRIVEDLVLPSTLREVPSQFAFMAQNLKGVDFSGNTNIQKIAKAAFYCSGLQSLTLPPNVKVVEAGAFAHCRWLHTLDLNQGLQRIESSAFEGATFSSDVIIPDGVSAIGDFGLFSKAPRFVIPVSLTEVGRHAFYPGGVYRFKGKCPPSWLTVEKMRIDGLSVIEYPAGAREWELRRSEFAPACELRPY